MERRRSTAVILALSFLCLLFGLGCTVIGIFGEAWWIKTSEGGDTFEDGVLRYCKQLQKNEQDCGYYGSLLSFKRQENGGM